MRVLYDKHLRCNDRIFTRCFVGVEVEPICYARFKSAVEVKDSDHIAHYCLHHFGSK